MTLLFVTEISPFPPSKGEKLRSYGLLMLLERSEIQTHAVIGSDGIIPENQKNITYYQFDFQEIKSSKRYSRLFTRAPKLTELIDTIVSKNSIDIAFIDYSFFGQYVGFLQTKGIPVIYGTHNAQAALFWQVPTKSIRLFLSKTWHFLNLRFHEFIYFRKADALIVVSEDDKKYHASFVDEKKIFVIPNFLDENVYVADLTVKENYIILSANFRAYQNRFGLEWFVNYVWNKQLWDRTKLLLVGFDSEEALNFLKEKYKNLINVTATGSVDDLKPYISKAKVSIVPLLHGSGTRLKCLESMALGTQLISTSKGAEGIEHENTIIIADTPEDFRNKLIDIIDDKINTCINSRKVFLKRYSVEPNKLLFKTIVDSLINKRSLK